jgi:hypothetical protein
MMPSPFSELVESLPKGHPYRNHIERHVDLAQGRVIKLDPNCPHCAPYINREV